MFRAMKIKIIEIKYIFKVPIVNRKEAGGLCIIKSISTFSQSLMFLCF